MCGENPLTKLNRVETGDVSRYAPEDLSFMIHSIKGTEGTAFLLKITLETRDEMRILQMHSSYEEGWRLTI